MRSAISLLLLGTLMIAGCDKRSGPAQQANETMPAASGAAAADKGKIDRSHKGEAAPDTAFTDPDGRKTSLAAFRGKPVLLNLWATWCIPCRAEAPQLEALEAAYAAGRDGLDGEGDARGQTLLTRVPELDAHFHLALAEATHNLVLVHLMHAIFELLRGSVVDNYRAIVGHGADLAELIDQHRRIFSAVASHDADSAQRSLREHLAFIRTNSGDVAPD